MNANKACTSQKTEFLTKDKAGYMCINVTLLWVRVTLLSWRNSDY